MPRSFAFALAMLFTNGCANMPDPSVLKSVAFYSTESPPPTSCRELVEVEFSISTNDRWYAELEPTDPLTYARSGLAEKVLHAGGNAVVSDGVIEAMLEDGGCEYWALGTALVCSEIPIE